jgi:hypothetical protein
MAGKISNSGTEKMDPSDSALQAETGPLPQASKNHNQAHAGASEPNMGSDLVPQGQEYASGVRFWLAVVALCLGIFLITLVS